MIISLCQPSLRLVKLTIFLFYLQIFWPLDRLRYCVYVVGSSTGAFYAAMTIVRFYFATPEPHETWTTHQLSPAYPAHERAVSVLIPAVGLVVDLSLLLIPIPAILQLRIQKKHKVGLICIFMAGLL